MRKLIKNSVVALLFAFSFVFIGTTVKADEGALNNTNIEGFTAKYTVAEEDYYVVKGNAEESSLKISSKEKGQWEINWFNGRIFYPYTAKLSVVKCSEYDSEQETCTTWNVYTYSEDDNLTNDDLINGRITLPLNSETLKEAKGATGINGAQLSKLDSIYGLTNTYFVITQYELHGSWFQTTLYEPDVFKVVFTSDISGLTINNSTNTGSVQVTITSGTPINTVRYFSTSTALEKGFDFTTKFEESGNGVVSKTTADTNPEAKDGVFTYTLTLNVEDGKYFYIEATDLSGNVVVKDIENGTIDDQTPVKGPSNKDPKEPSNVGNKDIGKIILISLLVVLVISLILVIVQKIVDYRKKLY